MGALRDTVASRWLGLEATLAEPSRGEDPWAGMLAVTTWVRVLVALAAVRDCELPARLGQRLQHVADGHVVAAPVELRLRDRAHGRCHSLPSCSSSFADAVGPHVPES